jgi:hypothetical protein
VSRRADRRRGYGYALLGLASAGACLWALPTWLLVRAALALAPGAFGPRRPGRFGLATWARIRTNSEKLADAMLWWAVVAAAVLLARRYGG